ncbi:hypothetical protein JTB14_016924 [Gonioctena quinquepunctata]|nr:hypothetical protein JTB14_016924 [Gonioctena quinquepunctata]
MSLPRSYIKNQVKVAYDNYQHLVELVGWNRLSIVDTILDAPQDIVNGYAEFFRGVSSPCIEVGQTLIWCQVVSLKKNLKRGVLPSITNDHGEEPTDLECTEDKENQNIIKGILEDINKEEKERKALVTKILEKNPSTSYEIVDTATVSQPSEEVKHLQLETSKLTDKNRQAQQKLKALEKSSCSCRSKLLKTQIVGKQIKGVLKKAVSENQIDLLSKKKKCMNWKPAEVATAFTLRYYSKKSYLFLRSHLSYPLPSLSSLRRWALGFELKQGILPDILSFMRLAGEEPTEMQKCVVLQYDEMKLKSVLEFDNAEDEIVGPYNYMQFIMVRGLFSKWKQPIYSTIKSYYGSNK